MTKNEKYKNLYKAILSLRNEKEVENFFIDLMTPQEIDNFADRLEVARQLDFGKSQRKVAEDTKVALVTVTRVNRFLKNGYNGYKLILDRLHHSSQSSRLPSASG
jgi:TrpR-related protein YerC/YecD